MSTALPWYAQVWAFFQLGRYQFLLGGFAFYGVGVAMAVYRGAALDWPTLLVGQLVVTSTQLMVHYSNDYHDLEGDINNLTPTAWSGGSRVLPQGKLPRRVALVTARVLALIAIVGTLVLALVLRSGPLTLPLAVLAGFLSWSYSAPPLKLHARGFGEFFGAFVLCVLTPALGFYLQTGRLDTLPLAALLPLCGLQLNMLLSVDLPDVEGDLTVNKRTLIARLGRPDGARLYLAVLVATYALLWPLTGFGLPPVVAVCFAFSLPLALWLAWCVLRGDWAIPARWGRFAFLSIVLLIGGALLQLAGFLWLAQSG